MLINKAEIQKRVEAMNGIPTLPGLFERINRLVEDPDSTARNIADVISTDQAVSAKVLRLVNSSFYGLPGKISSISQAVLTLGFDVVKGLVISTSVYDLMIAKGLKGIWTHSMACAVASGVIARQLKIPNADEISTAGLLHDIGKVVIKIEIPQEVILAEKEATNKNISSYQAEENIFGFNHSNVGHWLSQKWNLPKSLSEAIGFHHQPAQSFTGTKQTAVVHTADILINIIGYNSGRHKFIDKIDPKAWSLLNISDELLEEIIDEIYLNLENMDTDFN